MADLSDAKGVIKVKKIGNELINYLLIAQNDAEFKLIETPLDEIEVTRGNFEINFQTCGKWSYESNIMGYLNGDWFKDRSYAIFLNYLKAKNGSVTIEYVDSDIANDWIGSGFAKLSANKGKVEFESHFDEQEVSLDSYAELYGYKIEEAAKLLYGME